MNQLDTINSLLKENKSSPEVKELLESFNKLTDNEKKQLSIKMKDLIDNLTVKQELKEQNLKNKYKAKLGLFKAQRVKHSNRPV